MASPTFDLMLSAQFMLTVDPNDTVLEHHSLLIKDGIIQAIKPTNEALKAQCREHINYPHHILTPGLINMHAHSPMVLLRGLGDDASLKDWLEKHIWPAEKTLMSSQFVKEGTELAIAEMLLSGTTCFNEHYFFPEESIKSVQQFGIRAAIGLWLADVDSAWGSGMDDYLAKAEACLAQFDHQSSPMLQLTLAPHSPYLLSDESLLKVKALAEKHNLAIHMHVSETQHEVEQSLANHGERPVARLQRLGLLDHRFHAVHLACVDQQDIDILKAHHVHAISCPMSNSKLASGFCPVAELHQQGIHVALGTDGAASNNRVDMFAEMRMLALLGKVVASDPQAMHARLALRMATIHGAQALGWDQAMGSLEVGKACDVVAFDIDDFRTRPCHDPYTTLVYACSSRQIEDVWVAGKRLVHQGKLSSMDDQACLEKAKRWEEKTKDFSE